MWTPSLKSWDSPSVSPPPSGPPPPFTWGCDRGVQRQSTFCINTQTKFSAPVVPPSHGHCHSLTTEASKGAAWVWARGEGPTAAWAEARPHSAAEALPAPCRACVGILCECPHPGHGQAFLLVDSDPVTPVPPRASAWGAHIWKQGPQTQKCSEIKIPGWHSWDQPQIQPL